MSITLDRETGVTKPARLRRIEAITGAERPRFEDGVAILEVAGRDGLRLQAVVNVCGDACHNERIRSGQWPSMKM